VDSEFMYDQAAGMKYEPFVPPPSLPSSRLQPRLHQPASPQRLEELLYKKKYLERFLAG
jgi:hypothetical protein